MLKALILDVDGTLADTADVKRTAFNQAFAEFGFDWVWDRRIYAQIAARARTGCELDYFTLMRFPDSFQRLESDGTLGAIRRRQRSIYLGLLESGAAPLRSGVARLMSEAITGPTQLAICSTGARAEYETLLYVHFGLEMIDSLDCAIAADDLGSPTPLAAYRECLRQLHVAPTNSVAIDDSANGVAAAAGLGLTVVATPSYYTINHRFGGAAVVLSDLGHPAAPLSVYQGALPGVSHVTLETLESLILAKTGAAATAA